MKFDFNRELKRFDITTYHTRTTFSTDWNFSAMRKGFFSLTFFNLAVDWDFDWEDRFGRGGGLSLAMVGFHFDFSILLYDSHR
jgi:hypothetical protein